MATRTTIELDKHDYVSLLKRIKFFQNIIHELSARKPLQELLDQIIYASKKLLDAEAASLLLYNQDEKALRFHTLTGGTATSLKSQAVIIGEGIAGWVAEKLEPLIINDCYGDPRFNKSFDASSGFYTRNMICVPMVNKTDLIGVIQAINKKNNEPFTKEDLQLFESLAAQCAVAIENARLIDIELLAQQTKYEMEIAYKIQQRFLPEKLPHVQNMDVSIRLKSAKEIGGDYFNVIKIDEVTTLFFLADVSGKSIPAALIVSTLYSFLQFYFIVRNEKIDLVDMVQTFNRFLINSTTADKYATAWIGIFNSSDRSLLSITAGHNPTYLMKDGTESLMKIFAGGLMLGSMDLPYTSEKLELAANDLIVFYTDGIPEAMNEKHEEFGEQRFEELIIANKNLSPGELSQKILDEIKNYRGETEQSDDITIGILRIK